MHFQNVFTCAFCKFFSLGQNIGLSIPKVVGLIPTMARYIFQLPQCGYELRVKTTNILSCFVTGKNSFKALNGPGAFGALHALAYWARNEQNHKCWRRVMGC